MDKFKCPAVIVFFRPRSMIARFLDGDVAMFNAEKKNPYAKHLLYLTASWGVSLPNDCHLRHLRLLRRLELKGISLRDSLLNEISTLIHLRYLEIETEAKVLPLTFSNLRNLETLSVCKWGSIMVLSPTIWKLVKLQHVCIYNCAMFDPYTDEPVVLEEDWELENLRCLKWLRLTYWDNKEDIFKRFPNLESLQFTIETTWDDSDDDEEISFPRLDVLNKLKHVAAEGSSISHQWDFHFPSSLKELTLSEFDLTSNSLSRIGRLLPNLQILQLRWGKIEEGKEWDMRGVTFQSLSTLSLEFVSFCEWKVDDAGESFPLLQTLNITDCEELKEIPESFGDILSLHSIKLVDNPQLEESTLRIKEYVQDLTGEDRLDVIISSL